MSLLAPLFLIGLASIALPVWLHRLRSRDAERRPFSSIMLLDPQPPRLQLRKHWRYRLLMALRVLLLAALCGAFAQPEWSRHGITQPSPASLQLIVLDTSLSMGADGRFERARAEAERIIDRLGAGQPALVLSAADGLEVASAAARGPGASRAALRVAVQRLRPGPARLDYGAAMAALDSVLDRQRGLIEAHFISDFQASGMPTRFADLLPPAGPTRTLRLQLQPVASGGAEANWAVSAIRRSGKDIDVAVRGFGTPAQMLEVTLEINGVAVSRASQRVPAGAAAKFQFPHPILRLGDNRVVARLTNPDALAADNVRYAVIHNTPIEPVPLLSAEPRSRAVRYLSTALRAAGEGYQAQVQPLPSFDARALPRYRWVMIDDLGSIDDALAQQLRAFAANGGGVFAALGAATRSRTRLPLLGDALTGSAGESEFPLTVGQIDASHPLLSSLGGWESLNIGHLLMVEPAPADRVLVAASNGAPLLLERQLGRGRIVLYTSDLNGDWNDLPLQPLFVGLLAQMGRYLGGRSEFAQQQTVGASVSLGRNGGLAGQLIDPAGRPVLSLADTGRALTVKLNQTGFYQIYTRAVEEALVAVNPDLQESDLTPMPASVLARWRSALAARVTPADTRAAAAKGPSLALAPVLLTLLALLTLAEALLGNSCLHRRLTHGQADT